MTSWIPSGLKEAGIIEGQNLTIEYRFANEMRIACRNWPPICRRRVRVIVPSPGSRGASRHGRDQTIDRLAWRRSGSNRASSPASPAGGHVTE